MSHGRSEPLFRFEAAWLFLLAGVALLASAVLIPAYRDVETARWHRDRALVIESNRLERVERYARYLDAVERGQESVVLSLAAAQLNRAPEGWRPLVDNPDPSTTTASVFPALEPGPAHDPPRVENTSLLSRWATGERSRLWLIAAGALLTLIGIMPQTSARATGGEAGRG